MSTLTRETPTLAIGLPSKTDSAECAEQSVCRAAEISVLVLTRNEAGDLETLLPDVAAILEDTGRSYEMIVVDAASPDGTSQVAARRGARAVEQTVPGYANALRQGFRECRGELVVTLDA